MIDALKKMDKKFLITSGCLIFIPLLIILILICVRGCSGAMSYETYQDKMVDRAKKYFEYHDVLPSAEGKETIVTLDDLVLDGLKSTDKALNDDTCTGSVTVKKNGQEFFYTPYLECKDYTTDYLINHLKKNIVTEESGLHKINNEYIYKGNKVDNYISFYGVLYRIIKIDSNGNLRMIKSKKEDDQISWDSRYNVEAEDSVGINDYYNSEIYDKLIEIYNDKQQITDQMRPHLIAHNVCLDKIDPKDLSIEEKTCEKVLENQFLSIPTIYDYENASYDVNCTEIGSGACANYNYMNDVISTGWTINASSADTFSVYGLNGSYVSDQKALEYKNYYLIITISGNELYQSGNGTEKDPYVIR